MGINLMLAVPSNIFLQSIRRTLEFEEDIVADALNHLEVTSLIEQKRPDVLFIDTAIPHLNIMNILGKIRESNAPTKLLLLLHTQDEEAVIGYISSGVRGCLREASSLTLFCQIGTKPGKSFMRVISLANPSFRKGIGKTSNQGLSKQPYTNGWMINLRLFNTFFHPLALSHHLWRLNLFCPCCV